jgi:hypothetical protein
MVGDGTGRAYMVGACAAQRHRCDSLSQSGHPAPAIRLFRADYPPLLIVSLALVQTPRRFTAV